MWRIKLMDQSQVDAVFCKGGKIESCETKNRLAGSWSNIYDQSFRIELENGLRFLANFKYTVKPEISKDPTKDSPEEFSSLKTADYVKFDTHCDNTMIGFVQNIPSITNKSYSMAQHKI